MIKALNIVFIIILLASSFRDALYYVAFKIQQDQIAATLCVNLYEPALMCNGICYFDNTIQQAQEEEQSSSALEREEITQQYLIPQAPNAAAPLVYQQTAKPGFAKGWIPNPALTSVFRPPQA